MTKLSLTPDIPIANKPIFGSVRHIPDETSGVWQFHDLEEYHWPDMGTEIVIITKVCCKNSLSGG